MTSFTQACRDHQRVRKAAKEDRSTAEALWRVVCGADDRPAGYLSAVAETQPPELTQLLATGHTVSAYAFSKHWQQLTRGLLATPFELREMAREAWQEIVEHGKNVGKFKEGFGCDDSESWEHARDCSPTHFPTEIEKIAELAGRMFAALKGARASQASHMPEEIYSVELGADLPRLLPSELAHLGQPTEICLIERLADRRALQYAVKGEERLSRGPLVICLDESGSMHDRRNVWAKAAAVALTRIALEDRRSVSIVHYGSSCEVRRVEPRSSECLIDLAKHFMGGGTALGLALARSAQQVEELQRAGDRGADVVLVTDGRIGSARWRACDTAIDEIEKLGSRLWTVAIECNHSEQAPFRKRAERYVHVDYAKIAKGEVLDLQGCVNPR